MMQYVRSGYANYVSYFFVGLTFINTTFLTLIALGIELSYVMFTGLTVPLAVVLLWAVGRIHYKAGLYEGQVKVDIANNPYWGKLVPGKEQVFAATYLQILNLLQRSIPEGDMNTKEQVTKAMKDLTSLLEGKSVRYSEFS